MDPTVDVSGMTYYLYAAIGAGVLVVLAIVLSFLPIGRIKLPAIILSSIACLVAGFALGLLALSIFGYRWDKTTAGVPPEGLNPYAAMPAGGMGGGGGATKGPVGGGGGAPGGGFGGGMGGGRGPSAKTQLGNLVAKLELLTRNPLKIDLSDEQKAKIVEQLQGLEEQRELAEEEATKRLEALLAILEEDHETLEAVGFRVPGRPTPPPRAAGGQPPSPFMEPDKLKSLNDLKERISKPKAPN